MVQNSDEHKIILAIFNNISISSKMDFFLKNGSNDFLDSLHEVSIMGKTGITGKKCKYPFSENNSNFVKLSKTCPN